MTTTISEAELLYGMMLLPDGQRRRRLSALIGDIFNFDFPGRILPFDREAAEAYARIAADRRKSGRPISQSDAQIAGIARSRGAALATRNIRDFQNCGIDLIDPWAT